MFEEIPLQRNVRQEVSPGLRIEEFASPEVDLICPYFHQRFIAQDGTWFLCEGRFQESSELVRVDVNEGKAWRLTHEGAHSHGGDLGPQGQVFHFVRSGKIVALDVLTGQETIREIAMPEGEALSGLLHLNSDGTLIALSSNREHATGQKIGRIWTLSLTDGTLRQVIERPFQIGHVQFSTQDPGLLMYCHETGGASPQRMWLARTDGNHPGPLFDSPGHPWVTHESFCGNGAWISFIRSPEGMGLITKDNAEFLAIEAPGAWHCAANQDASVLVFDTHQGEIKTWERASGRIRTLADSEPYTNKVHAHPRFLPGDKAVIWTSTRDGRPRPAMAWLEEG